MDIERALIHEPIRSLELRPAITLAPETSLAEVVRTLQEEHVGCVLVAGPGRQLVGIFTERDLLSKVAHLPLDWTKERVSRFMTRNPEALRLEDPIAWALNLMHLGGYRHVPLTDEAGQVVGVVSVKDIVGLIVELFPAAVLNLPPNPRRKLTSEDVGGDD